MKIDTSFIKVLISEAADITAKLPIPKYVSSINKETGQEMGIGKKMFLNVFLPVLSFKDNDELEGFFNDLRLFKNKNITYDDLIQKQKHLFSKKRLQYIKLFVEKYPEITYEPYKLHRLLKHLATMFPDIAKKYIRPPVPAKKTDVKKEPAPFDPREPETVAAGNGTVNLRAPKPIKESKIIVVLR